jgi:hypothetical protein
MKTTVTDGTIPCGQGQASSIPAGVVWWYGAMESSVVGDCRVLDSVCAHILPAEASRGGRVVAGMSLVCRCDHRRRGAPDQGIKLVQPGTKPGTKPEKNLGGAKQKCYSDLALL